MIHKVGLFGQGFDSPRLHHNYIVDLEVTKVTKRLRSLLAEGTQRQILHSVIMMGTLWIRQAN